MTDHRTLGSLLDVPAAAAPPLPARSKAASSQRARQRRPRSQAGDTKSSSRIGNLRGPGCLCRAVLTAEGDPAKPVRLHHLPPLRGQREVLSVTHFTTQNPIHPLLLWRQPCLQTLGRFHPASRKMLSPRPPRNAPRPAQNSTLHTGPRGGLCTPRCLFAAFAAGISCCQGHRPSRSAQRKAHRLRGPRPALGSWLCLKMPLGQATNPRLRGSDATAMQG